MARRVTASIKPHKLDDVVEALNDVGLYEFNAADARGFTRHPRRSMYRGATYLALDDKILIEVVVADHLAAIVGDLIAANARTDTAGDGTVWVSPLELAIDVHTGEHDVRAS